MKKIVKALSAAALSTALCLGLVPAAFAGVTYEDRAIAIAGAGEYTSTDLFDNFKDVMPGDELDQPVTISNEGGAAVKVYMRAEAHDEVSNPLTYSEKAEFEDGKDQAEIAGQRDEAVATMQEFLRQLTMTVANDSAVVFEASPEKEAQLTDSVYLGQLAPGESMQLGVRLSLPASMGNEFAYRVGEVDWVFTVEEVEGTTISRTGDATPVVAVGCIAVASLAVVALAAAKRRSRQ